MKYISLKSKVTEDGGLCSLGCLALKKMLQLPKARATFFDLEKNKTGVCLPFCVESYHRGARWYAVVESCVATHTLRITLRARL